MQFLRWLLVGSCLVSVHAQTNLVPSEINADTTWSGSNLLQNTVTIGSNATVTIAPGARILMDTAATLVVNGAIEANGGPNEPVYFTRSAVGRRWKGIRFINARPSYFAHTIFEYADCAGTHLDYYDNDCIASTPPPARNYHEAIVAIASSVNFTNCVFQNLPDSSGAREGDAIAIISDDPQNPGPATAHFNNCNFISIGQGIHTRYSYILVDNCYFTDHHGDNDDIDMYGESVPPPMIRFNRFINPAHDDAINPTRCSAIIMGNYLTGGDDHGIVLRDKCNPIVLNNFISNFASGGISVQNQCDALIANNTIFNCGRGIRLFDHIDRRVAPYCLFPGSGRATVINTIIWDCPESLTLTDSPYTSDRGSHVTVAYCNIEGGQASAVVSANSTLTWAEGNLSVDPQLTITNFLLLPATSPMIDAGTNLFGTIFMAGPALDGNGDGIARIDIGAHEFLLDSADSNGDRIPDGWTARFGFYPGDPDIAATDHDLDMATTYEEYIADTNPIDAGSVLRLTLHSNRETFTYPDSPSRNVILQYTTNFLTWFDVPETNMVGNGALFSTNPAAFYQVRATLP